MTRTAADIAASTAATTPDATPAETPAAQFGQPAPQRAWTPATRPMVLPALYAGSAALQAFDAYSTLKAMQLGAKEANPLMQGVVGNPTMMIGVKAAVTAASIVAAEQMWRQHHQMRAIVMMAVSNGIMAAVAAHNASVIRQMQR
ncbi:MAG TPA: DUF5658 family protein [Vicinamibacterales bacterium]|nr:DUF5658 family protein [Vicinamibacterales bacterium]